MSPTILKLIVHPTVIRVTTCLVYQFQKFQEMKYTFK